MSDEDFLNLLLNMADVYFGLAKTMHDTYLQGFPDIRGNLWRARVQDEILNIQILIPQIDDDTLRDIFKSFEVLLQSLDEIDNQSIALIARTANLQPPNTEDERREFANRIDIHLKKGGGPFWMVDQSGYHELTGKTEQLLIAIVETRQQVHAWIDELLRR